MGNDLENKGIYPVQDALDLMTTCCNVFMDANLSRQMKGALHEKGLPEKGLSKLAPEILTLCGGRLDPFNFDLSKDNHQNLYDAGQLMVHLYASRVDKSDAIMSKEN